MAFTTSNGGYIDLLFKKYLGVPESSTVNTFAQEAAGSSRPHIFPNDLFKISGCALIVAPYHNSQDRIVGAVGVIGPARLNYARIIPLVNYTARMFGRLIGNNTKDYHEFRK